MPLRARLRELVPFALRVELARARRYPAWIAETPTIARRTLAPAERAAFGFALAAHSSPLARPHGASDPALQRGKERNVALAAAALDGLLVGPCQTFSYHRVVGRPSRLRGFRPGLELREGRASHGVGGGCCQVSNLLYLLALRAGMNVTERHRHGLDLFPDHERTVPFGCGATVFYNYADLRFENPLAVPVVVALRVADGALHGALYAREDPGFRARIYEVDHRFAPAPGGGWTRENRIRRAITRASDGALIADHEVAHNVARVLYDPCPTAAAETHRAAAPLAAG